MELLHVLWILGSIVLAIVFVLDRKVLRVDFAGVKRFVKTIVIGSSISLIVNLLVGRFPPLLPVNASSLLFVFWEDAIFSILLIYYAEKFLPRWAFYTLAVISSAVFGLGHLYQGWLVVILLSFYPYFVSYKWGKRVGYGTIMICHIIYDLIIYGNTNLIHYFGTH